MIDDYIEGASILEDDELLTADDVYIKRFAAALKDRLDRVTEASASTASFSTVAGVLGEITQDESMVAAILADRRRRIKTAEERRRAAQEAFFATIAQLNPAVGVAAEAARFGRRMAGEDERKALAEHDKTEADMLRAVELERAAARKLESASKTARDAEKIVHAGKPDEEADPKNERDAADALLHYKEALAQYRTDVVGAQSDYADRLKTLRNGQTGRLTLAMTALAATTPPALPSPNPDAESRGTSIKLRAIR